MKEDIADSKREDYAWNIKQARQEERFALLLGVVTVGVLVAGAVSPAIATWYVDNTATMVLSVTGVVGLYGLRRWLSL